jgi:hypothetical protein
VAKEDPLGGTFHARTEQPIFHHTRIQERADEFQQPFVIDPLGDLSHQSVVIDSIEGSHYTLPINSTFPRGLQLSALGIRLKVNLSTFFGRHTDKADWC